MTWTPERVEVLTSLWKRGESSGFIARTLGDTSRNAVIGKIHRLGLSAAPRKRRRAPGPKPKPRALLKSIRTKPLPPEPPMKGFLAVGEIPDDGFCKWVGGKTGKKEITWRYCGKPTGENGQKDRTRPRCAFHTAAMKGQKRIPYTDAQIFEKRRQAATRRKHGSQY